MYWHKVTVVSLGVNQLHCGIEVILEIYFFHPIVSVKCKKWHHDLCFRREIDTEKEETERGTTVAWK
jgi:hypothetical protein